MLLGSGAGFSAEPGPMPSDTDTGGQLPKLPFELEPFMSNREIPLTSLAALNRKAMVEALLDRYLADVEFPGLPDRTKGPSRDPAPKR